MTSDQKAVVDAWRAVHPRYRRNISTAIKALADSAYADFDRTDFRFYLSLSDSYKVALKLLRVASRKTKAKR